MSAVRYSCQVSLQTNQRRLLRCSWGRTGAVSGRWQEESPAAPTSFTAVRGRENTRSSSGEIVSTTVWCGVLRRHFVNKPRPRERFRE